MAEDEGQYSLPLAPATPAPSQPNTGRSVSMEALLGDVDTDLDRLGQLLGADGAVRRKAAKRVKRAFGVATSKHLSDALEVALHAQAVKHDAELQRVRSESKRDLNALRAELIGRMAAMAKGASAEEAAAEAEKAKAREARLATMESRLDALAHNLSGFVDHDQKMAKETEEKEQYKALLRERQFDGRAAPDRPNQGEDLGYGFRTDGVARQPKAMERWFWACKQIKTRLLLSHYGCRVRCAPRHSVKTRLEAMDKVLGDLTNRLSYFETLKPPAPVAEGVNYDDAALVARLAAAEQSIDTTNEALGLAREQLKEAATRSAQLGAQLESSSIQLTTQIETSKTDLTKQIGGVATSVLEFNDELSVATTQVATLTAVKHDAFAENILDLVAANAARLGLTGKTSGPGSPAYNDAPLVKRVDDLEQTVASHARHFDALDEAATAMRNNIAVTDLAKRIELAEQSIDTTNEALGIAKEQLGSALDAKSMQLNEQLDTINTQLGEKFEEGFGSLKGSLGEFNDELSVATNQLGTLTAVKHDTFAQNILDLVAENAARLGLTGNTAPPAKVDERGLQKRFMEQLATINVVQASDDQWALSDDLKNAISFPSKETTDLKARGLCDELAKALSASTEAATEAVRKESAERKHQDKLQTKERRKDAVSARDAAVAASVSAAAGAVALAGEEAGRLVDARMAEALDQMAKDMLKGSGALGDRVAAVEKTAHEALEIGTRVDTGVPLLINEQKKREKELWDFCRSELCRSGWFEERLNRLATAVDQKPDEARVKMLLRKLDATLRMHCGDGAALSMLVERIHGEVSRKLNRRDVMRLIEMAVDESETRLAKVAKNGGGARINAVLHAATLGAKGLPPGATSTTFERSTTLGRPRTAAQTAATTLRPDAASEIFRAIAQQVHESMDADLVPVETGLEPAPLKEAARWAASAASAAVLGLALQDVEKLSLSRGPTTQPVLYPGHTQAPEPFIEMRQTSPGFTKPPYDERGIKRTFEPPANQLILASYPNGRPGALRALSLAPPDQEEDFEEVPAFELSVRPQSGAMSPLSHQS